MAVRLVKEEDPQAPPPVEEARIPLKLAEPVWVPSAGPPAPQRPLPPEPEPPKPDLQQAITLQALSITVSLANILSVRLALLITILASAGLTLFAEAQHEHQVEAVVAAALFTIFALIPMVALALRKG